MMFEQPSRVRPAVRSLGAQSSLCRISARQAQAMRAWYGRCIRLPLPDSGHDVEIHCSPVRAETVRLELSLRSAGRMFGVQVVELGDFLKDQRLLDEGVPQAMLQAVLLHAAEPLWRAFETWLGTPVELLQLRLGGDAWPAEQVLGARLVLLSPNAPPETQGSLLLRAQHPLGWEALADAGERGVSSEARSALPLDWIVYADAVSLRLAELARLDRGDIVLLGALLPGDALAARLGLVAGRDDVAFDLAGAPLQFDVRARSIRARRRAAALEPLPSLTKRRHAMSPLATSESIAATAAAAAISVRSQVPAGSAGDGNDAGLDRLMVDVLVELGRLTLPLGALRSLAAGQVFETQHAIDGDGVVLWCGGQQIALGQLVAVGDRIGVRIVSVPRAASVAATVASPDPAP